MAWSSDVTARVTPDREDLGTSKTWAILDSSNC